MKKLFLLLSIPLMAFQCEPEPCQCVQENVFDNGTELVFVSDTPANQTDCDNAINDAYIQDKSNPLYWYRFIVKCE